jgi:hypothetical protein
MALEEYIPWMVVGGVVASAVAGCTAACTLHYTCKGRNDSSKDQAKYIKEDVTKQRVKDGVVLTDTKHILKIYAATNDSQTMLSNELEHKDNGEVAKAIANKDIGPLTVAALVSTVSSGLSSISNFFNSSKDINIAGDQNVIISDNTLHVEPAPQGLEYEVEVGDVNDPDASNTNYLNMLEEEVEVENSIGVDNQFIAEVQDLELSGNNIVDNQGNENI